MQDRISTKPNRVLITPETGQPYYATVTRADEPTQEGTALNKATLLQDSTALLFGLDENATPNDVFVALLLGANKVGFFITVKYSNGVPASGVTIEGITDSVGNPCVTNDKGQVIGSSDSATASLHIDNTDILDWESGVSQEVTGEVGKIKDVELTIPLISEGTIVYVEESSTKKISSAIDTLDISAVGGGGGGQSGSIYNGAGSGGGGGFVYNRINVKNTFAFEDIEIIVGAGGIRGWYINTKPSVKENGKSGGNSTVKIGDIVDISARGGDGGSSTGAYGNGTGGIWSNAYGQPTSPTNGATQLFNDSDVFTSGGGGYGGQYSHSGSSGGSPNGGAGGSYIGNYANAGDGSDGRKYGGGGGGGGGGTAISDSYKAGSGGTGGIGCVAFRWRYKVA